MTPQIHLHVLASGSKGNAAVVEGPEGSVLVDCGISRRALLQRAAEALRTLTTEATETVVAMHLSEKNNRPSVCVRTLAEAVGAVAANDAFTEARTPDGHLTICAAAQDWPMTVW